MQGLCQEPYFHTPPPPPNHLGHQETEGNPLSSLHSWPLVELPSLHPPQCTSCPRRVDHEEGVLEERGVCVGTVGGQGSCGHKDWCLFLTEILKVGGLASGSEGSVAW